MTTLHDETDPAGGSMPPPASPASGTDLQSLQARLAELERQNEALQKARGGAQKLAADKQQALDDVRLELDRASSLLQGMQAELESTQQKLGETAKTAEQLEAEAKAAKRKADVLMLAGQVAPSLVQILSNPGVQVDVRGETPDEITTHLKAFYDQFGKSSQPASSIPDTPASPAVASGAPQFSGGDKAARAAERAKVVAEHRRLAIEEPFNLPALQQAAARMKELEQ